VKLLRLSDPGHFALRRGDGLFRGAMDIRQLDLKPQDLFLSPYRERNR
jgi:hypothetical protein